MLAMVVNDDAGQLMPRGACSTIASKLAPTGWFGDVLGARKGRFLTPPHQLL